MADPFAALDEMEGQAAASPGVNDPFAGSPDDVFSGDLSDTGFVPAGIYLAEVTGLEKETSKSGNPMFTWELTVIQDDKGGKKYAGKTLRPYYTALTPAAMWKVEEAICALGLGQPGEKFQFKRSDALGKRCLVAVEETEYNGRTQTQVSALAPAKRSPKSASPAQGKGGSGVTAEKGPFD